MTHNRKKNAEILNDGLLVTALSTVAIGAAFIILGVLSDNQGPWNIGAIFLVSGLILIIFLLFNNPFVGMMIKKRR